MEITVEKINNSMLEKLLEKAQDLDWSYVIQQQGKRCYVELSKYSPLGEDFGMIIDYDVKKPRETFLNDIADYLYSFNPDEHAAMWMNSMGKYGVPDSVRDLIDDANDIKDMIYELWSSLTEEYKREINN